MIQETNFYTIRRQDRILDDERMIELLQHAEYGVLSLGESGNGYAYGVPISFAYSPAENSLYFHSALEGHKLDNLRRNNKISFCVVGHTQFISEDFTTRYESVIVFGQAEIAQTDEEKRFALRKLIEKYAPYHLETGGKYIASDLHRTLTFKMNIEYVTGKIRK